MYGVDINWDFLCPSLKALRDYVEGSVKHKQNKLDALFSAQRWIYFYEPPVPWEI